MQEVIEKTYIQADSPLDFAIERSFLESCNKIYEGLADHIALLNKKGKIETALNWIQMAAEIASSAGVGRYADGRIENIALEIGQNIENILSDVTLDPTASDMPILQPTDRRDVLHIATTVYPVGGHTRLIVNWIRNDPDSHHSLLLTDQRENDIPDWLYEAVNATGGQIITLPSKISLLSKAGWLRKIARSSADMVILHHHPRDVVPLVAFAVKQCPPVAILNHADHVFWLGSSVADTIINFRDSGKALSEKRRMAKSNVLLPIPLNGNLRAMSREAARKEIGVSDEQVMLLSTGSAFKYTPTRTHNFFRAVVRILDKNPEAHLYLIGVEWSDKVSHLREIRHDRLHFLGIIENPAAYNAAADIYLEGFPFGSVTALLDAARAGTCPVGSIDSPSRVLISDDIALSSMGDNARSEDEYVEKVSFLIRNANERGEIGNRIREQVIAHHTGEQWKQSLQAIYQRLESQPHEPRPIPNSSCMEMADDLALSRFTRLHWGTPPLVHRLAYLSLDQISFEDITRLLIISLKTRDTKISVKALRNWWGVFKNKAIE